MPKSQGSRLSPVALKPFLGFFIFNRSNSNDGDFKASRIAHRVWLLPLTAMLSSADPQRAFLSAFA